VKNKHHENRVVRQIDWFGCEQNSKEKAFTIVACNTHTHNIKQALEDDEECCLKEKELKEQGTGICCLLIIKRIC